MKGVRLWLVTLAIQSSMLIVSSRKPPHHRRSIVAQGNLPVSKGGWRPVVGSSGLYYGPLGTAPLHAPSYKIPVPVIDLYPSSARPIAARDVTKLTSIAQSYKPTTLRTVPVSNHPPSNQPINSYLNPFALPNNLNQYKFVQNFPIDSGHYRNQYNPYAARPVLQKQQTKQNHKQQYHNNLLQQLTNVQQIQFGQYSTPKPLDLFGKPIEAYSRPDAKRPQSAETEIFKPEVFKLQDTDAATQLLNQAVKTAQQTYSVPKFPINQYGHPFQDTIFPPSILGTFGSFGLQSVKGRDPSYPTTKTTLLPAQTTKQTLFNSFNYSPNFKSTPALFATTTPKLTTQNFNFLYSTTLNGLGNIPTPQTKVVSPLKIDPNAGTKTGFKPSPQDPFIKNLQNVDFNKITTYNPPVIQTSTLSSSLYNDYGLLPQNTVYQNYNQGSVNINYDKTKPKVSDNVGLTQQLSQQYVNAPGLFDLESSLNALSHAQRPSYAVVENIDDVITHTSAAPWTVTPQPYAHNQKTADEPVTKPDQINNVFDKPTTAPDLSEEYAIVTENDKNNENVYNYDSNYESQSRRPLGDDFEPIGKNKLKDYYYKISTPTYTEYKPYRRTKKPSEAPKLETTTSSYAVRETTEVALDTLPTLPPNKHFKRPNPAEPVDKDKIRKRNKIRRRRPIGYRKEESSTHKEVITTEPPTTTADEIHTIRPRIRPAKLKTEPTVTTPSETTELTTSALPTTAPTKPTVIKKKLIGHRRPFTTAPIDKLETTTQFLKENDYNRESPIMKISSRPQLSQSHLNSYEFKNSDVPDYSHKQDEKDTPTSDVSVSLTDTLKSADLLKDFSFHRDARPVEIKESTTESVKDKAEFDATTISTRTETSTRTTGKVSRPRLKNKFDRPKFSVKDYRSRLNSTTSTTEKVVENTPKTRIPPRKNAYTESIFTEIETTTERKKFIPKEPRHKLNRTENNEQEIHSRQNGRKKNSEDVESSTQRISSRIRNGQRRTRPTEGTTETTSTINRRPIRKRIQDSDIGESVQDISVTETIGDHRNDITEKTRSESAIMKIADKKHHDPIERLFEHSKRVSDLTLAASKDYNTPGMFKTVSSNSRRIPSYFTIATDDPILPIEAFFPQLNQKKES